MNSIPCKFFIKGLCKYGSNCKYSHVLTSSNSRNAFSKYSDETLGNPLDSPTKPLTDDFLSLDISDNKKNICKYFLSGNCTNKHCPFIHGYGDRLINISKIPSHNLPINHILKISENKFLTTDEKCLKIYSIESEIKCIFTNLVRDSGKISNVLYHEFFIFIIKEYYNETLMHYLDKNVLIVLMGDFKVEINLESSFVYDMMFFAKEKLLIIFGKDKIEVFNIDYSDNIFSSFIKYPIENGITSSCLVKDNKIVCGLENGYISILKVKKDSPSKDKLMSEELNIKVHNKSVNKVINKYVNDITNYIISSSMDLTVKILNFEKGLTVIYTKEFSLPVLNIFITIDYLSNELFCVAFEDGKISLMNNEFEVLFDIPSRNKNNTTIKRNGINFINSNKTEKDGNFFLLNDNNFIECNMWVNQDYDKKGKLLTQNINFI